ncbi:MAG: hypothetical protein AVDCRST_MAG39-1576, partial [uncultured Sphingomonadaceae bacterium]
VRRRPPSRRRRPGPRHGGRGNARAAAARGAAGRRQPAADGGLRGGRGVRRPARAGRTRRRHARRLRLQPRYVGAGRHDGRGRAADRRRAGRAAPRGQGSAALVPHGAVAGGAGRRAVPGRAGTGRGAAAARRAGRAGGGAGGRLSRHPVVGADPVNLRGRDAHGGGRARPTGLRDGGDGRRARAVDPAQLALGVRQLRCAAVGAGGLGAGERADDLRHGAGLRGDLGSQPSLAPLSAVRALVAAGVGADGGDRAARRAHRGDDDVRGCPVWRGGVPHGAPRCDGGRGARGGAQHRRRVLPVPLRHRPGRDHPRRARLRRARPAVDRAGGVDGAGLVHRDHGRHRAAPAPRAALVRLRLCRRRRGGERAAGRLGGGPAAARRLVPAVRRRAGGARGRAARAAGHPRAHAHRARRLLGRGVRHGHAARLRRGLGRGGDLDRIARRRAGRVRAAGLALGGARTVRAAAHL